MDTKFQISENLIKKNMDKGEFGLERESLRIDEKGCLSHIKHPFKEHPNITRDFCENQIELITDVFDNAEDVLQNLMEVQTEVVSTLQQLESGKEFLWPFSNPPHVKDVEDIVVAKFQEEQKAKTQYRNYLAEKYGKRKMLFSGIHLNYSFVDEMLREGYEDFLSHREIESYQFYKNQFYLQLAQKITKYSWFFVYLTAASPVLDSSFLDCVDRNQKKEEAYHEKECSQDTWSRDDLTRYASVRCGEKGYWNDFTPVFDYENLDTYIESIEDYIQGGQLKGVSELYYPVRVKPRGENSLEQLKERGINHIELRMLDVNPLSPVGLLQEDVEFAHYFLMYLSGQEDITLTREEQMQAVCNEKLAAEFDDSKVCITEQSGNAKPIRKAAMELLQQMEVFYTKLGGTRALSGIRYQKEKILLLENRYADRIRKEFGTDYMKRGINLAEQYTRDLLSQEQFTRQKNIG